MYRIPRILPLLLALQLWACASMPSGHRTGLVELKRAVQENPGDWATRFRLTNAQIKRANKRLPNQRYALLQEAKKNLSPPQGVLAPPYPVQRHRLLAQLFLLQDRPQGSWAIIEKNVTSGLQAPQDELDALNELMLTLAERFDNSFILETSWKRRRLWNKSKILKRRQTRRHPGPTRLKSKYYMTKVLKRAHELKLVQRDPAPWIQVFKPRFTELLEQGYHQNIVHLAKLLPFDPKRDHDLSFAVAISSMIKSKSDKNLPSHIRDALTSWLNHAPTPQTRPLRYLKLANYLNKVAQPDFALEILRMSKKEQTPLDEARTLETRLLFQTGQEGAAKLEIEALLGQGGLPAPKRLKRLEDLAILTSAYPQRAVVIDHGLNIASDFLQKRQQDFAAKACARVIALAQSPNDRERIKSKIENILAEFTNPDHKVSIARILARAKMPKIAISALEPLCSSKDAGAVVLCLELGLRHKRPDLAKRSYKRMVRETLDSTVVASAVPILRANKKIKWAKALANKVLNSQRPTLALILSEYEESLRGAGDSRRQKEILKIAAKRYPKGDAIVAIGEVHSRRNEVKKAERFFRSALANQHCTDRARVHVLAARAHLRAETPDFALASQDLNQALHLAPKNLPIVRQVAEIASTNKRLRMSEAKARELLIAGNPDSFEERMTLSHLWMKLGHWKLAQANLQRALQHATDPVRTVETLISSMRRTGPIRMLWKILNGGPASVRNRGDLYFQSGLVAHRRGSREQAALFFQRAIELFDGENQELLKMAGRIHRFGFYDLALSAFERSIDPMSSGKEVWIALHTSIKAGRLEQASIYANQLIKTSKKKRRTLIKVGKIFERYLRYKLALNYYDAALKAAPSTPRNLIMQSLRMAKNVGASERVLPLVRLLIPDPKKSKHEKTLKLAADVLIATGHGQQAYPYLARWAQLRPAITTRWLELTRLNLELGKDEAARETVLVMMDRIAPKELEKWTKEIRTLFFATSRSPVMIQAASEINAQHPGLAEISILNALGHLQSGQANEAHKHLIRAIHEFREPENHWEEILQIYRSHAPSPLMLRWLTEVRTIINDDPRLDLVYGDILLENGKTEGAMRAYDRCMERSPSRSIDIAKRLITAGHPQEALRFFQRATQTANRESMSSILQAYFKAARSLKGDRVVRKIARRVLREKGGHVWILESLVNAFVQCGMVLDSQAMLLQLDEKQANSESQKALGILSYMQRDLNKMRTHFRTYVHATSDGKRRRRRSREGPPAKVQRQLEVANFLADEGMFDESMNWIKRAQNEPGGLLHGQSAAAYQSLRAGNLEEALEHTRTLIKQDSVQSLLLAKPVFDLATRLDLSCPFIPLVESVPEESGIFRSLVLYKLSISCPSGRQPDDDAAELLNAAEVGEGRVLIMAGNIALEHGRFDDGVRFFERYLYRWAIDSRSKDIGQDGGALSGLFRAVRMSEKLKGSEDAAVQRILQKHIERVWQGSGDPIQSLRQLVFALGIQLNEWDMAAELSEKLLGLDPKDKDNWLRRVEIAMQRPDTDEIWDIFKRLQAARGPSRKAFAIARAVWMETGEIESITKAREILEIPNEGQSVSALWKKLHESIAQLNWSDAQNRLATIEDVSGGSLFWDQRLIDLMYRIGWNVQGDKILARALRRHPENAGFRWIAIRRRLQREPERDLAIQEATEWLSTQGFGSSSTPFGPKLKDIINEFTSQEFERILNELSEDKLSRSDLSTARLILAIRQGKMKRAHDLMSRLVRDGHNLPNSLTWALDESARAQQEQTARLAWEHLQTWAGRIKGDLHAIHTLENSLAHEELLKSQRQFIGSLGSEIVKDYLKISAPGLSSTTNLATFQTAMGNIDEATREYRSIGRRAQGLGALRNNLAYHFATNQRNLSRGLELVDEAILLEPAGAAYYLDTRGWLHHQNNQPKRAYDDILASLRIGPLIPSYMSSESLGHAAEVAWKLGKRDIARRHALRARLLTQPGHKLPGSVNKILRDLFSEVDEQAQTSK